MLKCRRLRCDYERQPAQSEAFIYIAMIGLMTRRLARKNDFPNTLLEIRSQHSKSRFDLSAHAG